MKIFVHYSNTTLVTLQRFGIYNFSVRFLYSNTTLVTVHPPISNPEPVNLLQFKYNSCYYSTPVSLIYKCDVYGFKYSTCYYSTERRCLSLQNSNITSVTVQLLNSGIIINHYSNTTFVTIQQRKKGFVKFSLLFKYNTCYSSTEAQNIDRPPTRQFKYNTCYGSARKADRSCSFRKIQIQHLLLFNIKVVPSVLICRVFKYNTCYCSTSPLLFYFAPSQYYSNTTPVTVQRHSSHHFIRRSQIQIQHLLLFNVHL